MQPKLTFQSLIKVIFNIKQNLLIGATISTCGTQATIDFNYISKTHVSQSNSKLRRLIRAKIKDTNVDKK